MAVKSSPALLAALFLLVPLPGFTGCDSRSETSPSASQTELEQACYHFTVEEALEFAATCQEYRVVENPDKTLSLSLKPYPLSLTFVLPPDLEPGEYTLHALGDGTRENSIQTALFYIPLDTLDRSYDHTTQGTFTVLRADDHITALFSMVAQTDDPDAPAARVHGHLRDLPLSSH